MTKAPERIWAAPPDIFDNMSIWQDAPPIGVNWPVYTRDDLCAAQIAAAYEAAGDRAADVYDAQDMPSGSDVAGYIRALAPDHARAALDRLLAEARREGWEAAKEAAARKLDEHDSAPCRAAGDWQNDDYIDGQLDAARSWQHAIRAMPYDKEDKE